MAADVGGYVEFDHQPGLGQIADAHLVRARLVAESALADQQQAVARQRPLPAVEPAEAESGAMLSIVRSPPVI
ncbi:hypothetical protein QP179_07605 [Sphingomonas aurantiaca]